MFEYVKNTLFVLLVSLALFNCQKAEESPVKPNVLFIAIDDLRNELGAYGSRVKSPNMDALAAEGTLFTHHYVQVPTCGASRHALLTGYRPWKPVHLSNQALEKELSDKSEGAIPETFIHRLKQAGYHTVGIGKISHSADGFVYGYEDAPSRKRELPHSWSELVFDPGKWKTGWNAFFAYANGENRQSLKKQVKPYEKGAVDDQGYPDGLTTELALSKLRELQQREEPFFMGIGFFKPHLPFNAPIRYWDLYHRDSIAISPNPNLPQNINLKSLHESGEFNQYALGDEEARLQNSVSNGYARKLKHAYFASISYIDAQVGRIREELNTLGLAENTIIVIWGDHGWHLGDQRVWGKHTLFESALKSTLIIKSPFEQHQGKKVASIAETVDIYPTLMELCDIEIGHDIDGESLVGSMESLEHGPEDVAYSYFKQGISMRTGRYRLTQYFRNEAPIMELFDYHNDPFETKNIALQEPDVLEELLPLLSRGNTGLYEQH